MDAFSLTKWYLDVTDDQGRSAVAYWTRVAWGPLALGWEGLTRHDAAGPARHRSSFAVATEPGWVNGRLEWRSRGLGCHVACEPWSPPFESTLLDSPEGSIEWGCQVPGGTVTVDAGDGCPIRGSGYAERLVLTIVPWRLPITELRWGRWLSPRTRRSVVWIDWRGAHPLTLVLDRGCPQPAAVVDDERVAFGGQPPAGDRAPGNLTRNVLRLDAPATLYTRTLSEMLRGLGPLASRLPASWLAVEDLKRRSLGILRGNGVGVTEAAGETEAETGWAIHEVVRFPAERVSP